MSKVLIIEDELDTAEPVKKGLELEGIQANIATDGASGLSMFQAGQYDWSCWI